MSSVLGIRSSESSGLSEARPVGWKSEIRNPKSETLKAMVLLLATVVLPGCGKEGPPLPPEIRIAERTTDLTAFQEGEMAVLQWSYPTMTTAGETLTDIEAVEVWRATLPRAPEPPAPMTAQDRALQRQLLESEGEVIQSLDPAELAAATRGSSLVFNDDLNRWREGAVGDPETMVVWYGVRTICCRKRQSDLSNVVRLLPARPPAPPQGLRLTAGASGIDVQWEAVPEISVVVERSADGTTWTRVTETPVKTGEWRDGEANQGRAWSYRLRSVTWMEGAEVVGDPSAPARIEHPDTYPPPIPENVVCLPEGATVRVRWRLVPGAVSYVVARRAAGEAEVLASDLTTVEYTDHQPPLGDITYLVSARDAAGNTSDSAECSVVMGAEP
jgi:predicted small lipoprotein YifL